MKQARRVGLVFIFLTLFLDILGIGIIVPVLPELVSHFLDNNLSHASFYFGAIVTAYALMQFFFAPMLGSLSDRYGRRPVLLISLLGSAIDYFILALSPTLWWLFISRMISGLTGSNITVGMAYIADVSAPEKRAQNFGLVGAAFGLGFTLGPALGGILGAINLRFPFYAAGILTLLNLLYGAFVLPESHPVENRRPFAWKNANPLGSFHMLRRSGSIMGLAGTVFFAGLAQHGLQSTWVLYTTYRFHWSTLDNGLSLAVVGIGSAIVQGGLIRRVIPRLGEWRTMLMGLGIGVVSFVLYGLATQGWMMYGIIVLSSLGGMAGPAAQGLVSGMVGIEEQGAIQGAMTSLGTSTRVIGPLVATNLFGYWTSSASPFALPGISFFIGAAFLAVAFSIGIRLLSGRAALPSQQSRISNSV